MRQAELDRQAAIAAYLPKLDGSVMAVFRKDTRLLDDVDLQMRGTYMAGLNLTQPIFAGGKIVTANKLAKVGQEAARLQKAQTLQQVIADADNAYFTLMAVNQKVTMLEALHRQLEELYGQVKTSVEADMATQNDLLRISAKLSEIEYQLQKARSGAEICRLSLCNVMGVGLDVVYQPVDTLLAESSVIPGREELEAPDISLRPELGLLEQSLKASRLQVQMQRANILPTVGLSVGYSRFANLKLKGTMTADDGSVVPLNYKVGSNNPMAMLSVSIPIFHWGAEVSKVRRAKYDVQAASLDKERNTRLLTIEARNAARNLDNSRLMLETAVIGQEQADENLRVMRLRYDAALSTLTDLLDAEAQWQTARSNLIEAQTQLRINETEYLRTTGRLILSP